MLRELHISNLAVIEDLAIELSEGFNCFTGQTGAGKSLVLGAFEILLGLRAVQAAEVLRPGAEEARISGVFEIGDPRTAAEVGQLLDQALQPGDGLLLTRKVFASGRSSLTVNGQPATAAMVRAVGELLVDIHGQHDHQFLLKPANQLLILDAFARCEEQRRQFAQAHARLRELRQKRETLTASAALREQQLDLYQFQADEIDRAGPTAGEYAELTSRHALLANAQRLQRDAGQVHAALHESEGAVVERLQAAAHVLGELAEISSDLAAIAEQVRNATIALQDAAYDLGRFVDRVEVNPAELAEVDERLNLLNRLVAKYVGQPAPGQDPIDALLAFREQIGRQIGQLRSAESDLSSIDRDLAAGQQELRQIGQTLSQARRSAAERLTPRIEAQMRELGMTDARLQVEFQPAPEEQAGPTGLETAEFLVQTNPGQPARPLRRIASGGEISRIMLAIKSVFAHSDRVSVLVFDEIDANIGGRMGTVIGTKLRDLAHGHDGAAVGHQAASGDAATTPTRKRKAGKSPGKGDAASPPSRPDPAAGGEGQSARVGEADGRGDTRHQVICITHLPQIAAYADRHFRVAKAVEGRGDLKRTRTTVTHLDGDARIEELAEMLAGREVSDTTRRQVRELLAAAKA